MSALTRWVLAHKRIVTIFWLVLAVVGIASANKATKALDQKFSVPGKEGWETSVAISDHFGGKGGDTAPIVPVVSVPQGRAVTSPGVRSQLEQLDQRLAKALPGARIASFASTGSDSFVSSDGRTTFAIVYPKPDPNSAFGENPDAAKAARAALNGFQVGGAPVHVSGYDALQNESGGDNGTGVLLESVLGGFGALIILAFVFASFLALVPLAMAIVSIMTTFLLVWGLTAFTDISPVVQFLIALVGLGIAIDYSLLVVSRWREERAHGRSGDEAVQRAMETAGRAVVFSGTTVAIGLLAMVALPVPFLRSMGTADADPAGQHARRDHPAPRGAVEVGTAPRLAPQAHRRSGQQSMDPLGRGRGPSSVAGRRDRDRGPGGARGRRDRADAGRRRAPTRSPSTATPRRA